MVYYFKLESVDTSLSYINSTHGKPQLIFHGAKFCVKQKNLNSVLWRCVKSNCSASVSVSKNDTILRLNENHNHLIDPNEVKILELRHKLKQEAQSSSTPIDKIVELGYSSMIIEQNINDSIIKFPTLKTLKNTVSKQRRRIRPRLPKSINDLPTEIPILYTLTKRNSNFLLFNGYLAGKRALIFASLDDIKYLAHQKFWYADGTFYTSPSMFYQIYSIHAFDEGLSTPCIYSLLADKSEETYYDLFSTLIKKINEITHTIKVESITIDFEVAVKNVFYKHYQNIQVRSF